MNFNLKFEKLNKKNYQRKHYGKILTVRLPCNPIFPIGPIYLTDHIHKSFPSIEQHFFGRNRLRVPREFYRKFMVCHSAKLARKPDGRVVGVAPTILLEGRSNACTTCLRNVDKQEFFLV